MKRTFRRLVVGAAAAVTLAGVGVMAGGGAALAAGSNNPVPPWEASITAGQLLGQLTFYNAQGQVVTGGSITAAGLGVYAAASTAAPAGYTKATLYAYTPVSGQNPGLWSGQQLSSSTNFPNPAAPDGIGTTANPVETNPGTDVTIQSYITAVPNVQTAAGYPGLYDVRMKATGAGLPALAGYWDTVISVNTTTNTWSVNYPNYTQNTTTTLAVTPPSPQTAPAVPVTLTATVTPATGTPAATGSVTFFDGLIQVGATQTLTAASPTATITTTPTTGSHSYTAVYTPPIGSADIGSTSAATPYVVGTPADVTTTTLAQTGGGGAAGTPVNFTATVTDTTTAANNPVTAGTVAFYDNGSATALGTATATAASNPATYKFTFTYNAAGNHSVQAVFTPNAGNTTYASSTSAAVTFIETAAPCTTCNNVASVQATVPTGVLSISTPYTMANPLNLGTLAMNAAGTYLTASAQLDPTATDVPTAGQYPNTTFNGITVVNTRAGNVPWTVTALASNLGDGGTNPGSRISGENVGLTGLTAVPVPGNALTAANLTFTNQPAATPPVAPTDPGALGLGDGTPHLIVTDSVNADGTIGINGTVTLNAPTSTEAGLFAGTITFTVG